MDMHVSSLTQSELPTGPRVCDMEYVQVMLHVPEMI